MRDIFFKALFFLSESSQSVCIEKKSTKMKKEKAKTTSEKAKETEKKEENQKGLTVYRETASLRLRNKK